MGWKSILFIGKLLSQGMSRGGVSEANFRKQHALASTVDTRVLKANRGNYAPSAPDDVLRALRLRSLPLPIKLGYGRAFSIYIHFHLVLS